MKTYLLLSLFVIVFVEMLVRLQMIKSAREIAQLSQESMRVLVSSSIEDDERESRIRRGSVDIFKSTGRLSMNLLAIGLVLYPLYLLTVTLLPDLEPSLLDMLGSPAALLILTAVAVCYTYVRKIIFARI